MPACYLDPFRQVSRMSSPSSIPGSAAAAVPPLVLEPVVGPPIANISIEPGKATVLGRGSACQVILADESVSRRHAQVQYTDGRWFVTDLGSRHGTHINAIRLESNGATTLQSNDLVGIGPWTFRVRTGADTHTSHITTEDRLADAERVERVHERELAAITHNRLNLLMKYMAEIAGISDESNLAKAIVGAAIEGTGFPRAAILRDVGPVGDGAAGNEFEIICERGPREPLPGPNSPGRACQTIVKYSTSLIKAARAGEIAILTADSPMSGGSIISLGIRTAMCAPIEMGGAIGTFLYLDARQGESGGARGVMGGVSGFGQGKGAVVQQDSAAFCRALSKMYALAMGNIRRKELEDRQVQLERELNAARETQRLIMPPESGRVGGVQYAMRMRSGRYVAGDLFDVVELDGQSGLRAGAHLMSGCWEPVRLGPDGEVLAGGAQETADGRVAVFLGDVAGKGIAAAILMATAQTHLNASLKALKDPALAVAEVNRYVCCHASKGRFISLWLGIFDPATREVVYVDAGHGHWLVVSGHGGQGARSMRSGSGGGLLIGVDADFPYRTERLRLEPGDRVVIFSDGVVEQSNPEGVMFGLHNAVEALRGSSGCGRDVSALFESVVRYAQSDSLQDDTTVASVTFAARG